MTCLNLKGTSYPNSTTMRANYLTIKVLLAAAAYINYLMMNYFYLQRLFYYLSSGQEMVHW